MNRIILLVASILLLFGLPACGRAREKPRLPAPAVKILLPDAEQGQYDWKYTFEKPNGNWIAADYDDSGWKTGPGGFGTLQTPGSPVHTAWNTPHIWLRRSFTLDGPAAGTSTPASSGSSTKIRS